MNHSSQLPPYAIRHRERLLNLASCRPNGDRVTDAAAERANSALTQEDHGDAAFPAEAPATDE